MKSLPISQVSCDTLSDERGLREKHRAFFNLGYFLIASFYIGQQTRYICLNDERDVILSPFQSGPGCSKDG